MWAFPLAASLVALALAVQLARSFFSVRRPYHAAWAAAFLMYAGGSLALFLGALDGWSPGEYRAFWLLGAVLNVPYLALGEGYLLVRRRVVLDVALVALLFATAFALHRVRTASIDAASLVADLPRGSEVFAGDPFALGLARVYSYSGYALLVAGATWSAMRMRRAAELRNRFVGTLAIVLGATVVAAGSAFAAAGNLPAFSLTIAAGVAGMFWGSQLASRPVETPSVTSKEISRRG